jgi:glycine/D-amino acid oxidase-like deaminating enzyme
MNPTSTATPNTHGLWEQTAAPAPSTEPLTGEQIVDVAVIGAGYTGLSAALHLSELGATVAVVEAVDIGHGGSGRNVGLVNAGLWVKPDEVVAALGASYADRLLSLLGEAPSRVFKLIKKYDIQCEAQRSGTLHCAVGTSGLRNLEARTAQWQARGVAVQLLDRSQTAARTGTEAYSAALLDPRAGTIQPLGFARGLATAAKGRGVHIFTRSEVRKAERASRRWRVVTDSGCVCAPWVVVATDAYTTGPWPQIRTQQVLLPYFNVATAPLPADLRPSILPEKQGAWDTCKVLSSFRLDQQLRLIFGSVGALRGTGTAIHRAWARRSIRKIFPQLGEIELGAEWFGMMGVTGDNMPRFHRLAPNVIAFSGFNGRGIAPGTAFGAVLADYISGRMGDSQLPLPATDPRETPFRRIREAAYEVGSQLAHLTSAYRAHY